MDAFAAYAQGEKESRRKAEIAAQQAEIERARRERRNAFEEREERRARFVAAIADKLSERSHLTAVLSHLAAIESNEERTTGDLKLWIERRLTEVEAILSPTFLDLSCRSAKIDFNEARAAAAKPEPSWYYRDTIELRLWSVDEAEDHATSQTPYDWALKAGWIEGVEGEV